MLKRNKMAKRGKGIKHHIIHKSKLSLLLLLKILFAFLSFFLVMAALSIISPWANIGQLSISSIIIWGISLTIIIILYLVMVIRMLRILKLR
jgi:hypothetical protein